VAPRLLRSFEVIAEWFENVKSAAYRRKCRGTVTPLLYDYGYFFVSPELRETLFPTGEMAQSTQRRTLSPDTVALILKLSSQGATLRAIAAAVGVSHETVRNYLAA
jgi:DNA-binding NarL/FixJ family response regulator